MHFCYTYIFMTEEFNISNKYSISIKKLSDICRTAIESNQTTPLVPLWGFFVMSDIFYGPWSLFCGFPFCGEPQETAAFSCETDEHHDSALCLCIKNTILSLSNIHFVYIDHNPQKCPPFIFVGSCFLFVPACKLTVLTISRKRADSIRFR